QKKPAEPTAASKNNENRFGNEQEAEDDMLKAFGIEKKPESKKAFNVIDDSDDALAKALKEFNSEMSNISSTPMFNPNLMTAAFKIGMIHLQRGLNDFTDWSKEMIQTSPQLKPFLNSVWDSVHAYPKEIKFDDNKMSAVMRYVGTQYDKGVTDKEELKKQLTDKIGAEYANLIDPAYAGVVKFPTKEEIQNVNDSTDKMAERTGKGTDQNTVGKNDGGEKSSGRTGQSNEAPEGSEKQTHGNNGVRDGSTAVSGKTGDSTVQDEKSEDSTSSAGSLDLPRSVVDSLGGQSFIDDGRKAADIGSTENGRNNAAVAKPVTKEDKQTAADVEAIQKAMPMLLSAQAGDVHFAEKRLFENKVTGVMFTNSTGTGKTFTGLGVIKRFSDQGKNNVLIVTPSNEINAAWIGSGKDFFGLDITPLKDTNDSGKGIVITTYANMGYNNELAKREWDLVVTDEAQELMSSEKANVTDALKKLRAITYHHDGMWARFDALHAKENAQLDNLRAEIKAETDKTKIDALEKEESELRDTLSKERRDAFEQWKQIPDEEKPKVVFLSATPFAYVPCIDYAEGYLFNYPKKESGSYNTPDGKSQFFMQNFGYRMRYNKLTRPEASVNSSVMEVMFHQNLRNSNALSGRMMDIDRDYDRGFVLIDGGIGKKIDEGFSWLNDKKNGMQDIGKAISDGFKGNARSYLLEAVKAKGAIPLVKQYLKQGKKVVVFHGYKKGGSSHPFRLDYVPQELQAAYEAFQKARPDLYNLNMDSLYSPIVAFKEEFGDDVLVFNGDVDKKLRPKMITAFNDDNSGKNIILVQQDAGQAGISLHDTTGKHQRVLMNLGMPTKPVAAIQIEGRIYRVGQKSDAIIRYLNTGTNMEKYAFANKIAERASTAENLALGTQARALKDSFI
ncbi:MAG: DEAD/DEAH box helicase family protein, partial [Selenomonadaceae bacterium]